MKLTDENALQFRLIFSRKRLALARKHLAVWERECRDMSKRINRIKRQAREKGIELK